MWCHSPKASYRANSGESRCEGGLRGRDDDAGRDLPLDAGAHAELVVLGIRHSNPTDLADALHTLVKPVRSDPLEPLDLGFDVVDDDVEMHAVLPGLRLRYALEDEWRCDP